MLEQIFRPLLYLRIIHPQKWKTDWAYPIVLAIPYNLTTIYFKGVSWLSNSEKSLSFILGFLQTLPGFYIAALAVVASFGRRGMDQYISGTTPLSKQIIHGEIVEIKLTRRRFLAMLFSYLTFLSIVMVVMTFIHLEIKLSTPPSNLALGIFAAFHAIYSILFFQLVVVTLWGVYYMGYRIYEED
ncbi:hypothetical protein [Pseudomonas aeruginosa]|uniref:hypothetical protein n=1 Tax=Pseudomonas aeruginosa TaxID=287 RepID=UPI00383A23C4|nr:hypothetical protein [Pseudomonas aeruginosa]HCE9672615.1 hypothetical protein [Pseudomonas aeruginosa]HCE9761742.1 hypothetical protein [Pseudomonas aeruginosa]HCE9763121.1 hypothetical protein [Pseudomonas aeruginosa]HCF0118011.1 hypothetical protein [Pseudomonas aeruginosa]